MNIKDLNGVYDFTESKVSWVKKNKNGSARSNFDVRITMHHSGKRNSLCFIFSKDCANKLFGKAERMIFGFKAGKIFFNVAGSDGYKLINKNTTTVKVSLDDSETVQFVESLIGSYQVKQGKDRVWYIDVPMSVMNEV